MRTASLTVFSPLPFYIHTCLHFFFFFLNMDSEDCLANRIFSSPILHTYMRAFLFIYFSIWIVRTASLTVFSPLPFYIHTCLHFFFLNMDSEDCLAYRIFSSPILHTYMRAFLFIYFLIWIVRTASLTVFSPLPFYIHTCVHFYLFIFEYG